MVFFNSNIFKKMDIILNDDKKTILKKIRLAMAKRIYPIQEIALIQKQLIDKDSIRALSIFHLWPPQILKTESCKKRVKNADFSFLGKIWEK